MTTTKSLPLYALIAVAIVAFGSFLFSEVQHTHAADTNDNPATVATTSNPTVGTTASILFATSTCAARTISTTASPIMLTFSDAQGKVPTATFGVLQAASTTVAYDGSQYGCATVRAYSFVSSAITIQESR